MTKIAYDRARDLPRLMPLWPEELANTTPEGNRTLVARLEAAVRRERERGIADGWAYSPARHRQMIIALNAERAALERQEKAALPLAA
jgi:hypothetical protein